MKASQHLAFRSLLKQVIAAAHDQQTAAQGYAAWMVLMKTCEMPRHPEHVTEEFLDRCCDWFSERIDGLAPALASSCTHVWRDLIGTAMETLHEEIVIVP